MMLKLSFFILVMKILAVKASNNTEKLKEEWNGWKDILVHNFLRKYNAELEEFNRMSAQAAWNFTLTLSSEALNSLEEIGKERNSWNNIWCSKLMEQMDEETIRNFSILSKLNPKHYSASYFRQIYLICKGPKFTRFQFGNVLSILGSLQELYNRDVCIDEDKCMKMEPEMTKFMETTRDERQLWKAWNIWHRRIGADAKPLYINLVELLNAGAKQAGYHDIGDVWRDELEINDMVHLAENMYLEILDLYKLLHAYVRHKLERFYGIKIGSGPIPAHLLGTPWGMRWTALMDIVWSNGAEPRRKSDAKKPPKETTVSDMLSYIEKLYESMGFPPFPKSVKEKSILTPKLEVDNTGMGYDGNELPEVSSCHASAANMWNNLDDPENMDLRLILCDQVDKSGARTMAHELGHILYFMAYSNLPTIFQDGANPSFHEAIGDALALGVFDEENELWMEDLFRTALQKLPDIVYSLMVDYWRWDVFKGQVTPSEWNDHWWKLNYKLLGVGKPDEMNSLNDPLSAVKSSWFDPVGKFHIVDNVPCMRYFFAHFLQFNLFEAMCERAGYHVSKIHQCKLVGSKPAGQLLWNIMEKGRSVHYSEILLSHLGYSEVTTKSLINYFQPLKTWLEIEVILKNITVGW